MKIIIREVAGKIDLRRFIYLPEKIHQQHTNWVHPLYMDENVFFNPKKNKSFAFADTVLFLAWQGEQVVGRIMGIINHKYNELHGEKNARFCFLDCYEIFDIAGELLRAVEHWAHEKGMDRLIGPLAFSDKDPQGVLIEGFKERVLIATNYNFPWMKDYLEKLGFEKELDLVSYKVQIPEAIPEYLIRVFERAVKNGKLKVHEFTARKALRPWIIPIFRLINETYSHIYGFIPLTEKEMNEFADRYLPVLNPRFIFVITNSHEEVVAFLISMPELSEGIRKAKGRVFPFGWWHILRESKRTRLLTMLLGAIKPEYRGKGLDSILGIKLLEAAHRAGMEVMDSHLILESNTPMRNEYERIGGVIHKRYRIFFKPVSQSGAG
jgi:GNAT superfamily N-acetyltransferase